MKEKVTAILLAAGKGTRMRSSLQKQYMELCGKPVIYYALQAFEKSKVDEIILVVAPGETEYAREQIVREYGFSKIKKIVTGGAERYESVHQALCASTDKAEENSSLEGQGYVLIHDGARAFITSEQIDQCILAVEKYKACVMGMPVKDTIKIVDEDCFAISTPKRSTMWQIQTPQCFVLWEIREAYQCMMESGNRSVTDDAMVMETYGNRRVKMIKGGYENIKITTPEDMAIGEAILKNRNENLPYFSSTEQE